MNRHEELTILDIAHAKVLAQEPDRARIKWRKRKWHRQKRETTFRPTTHRPEPKAYYEVLRKAGTNLCVCARCGGDYRITVHHKDGNPYNNQLENLEVLCWHCHILLHDPSEDGVHHELEGTKADRNPLDDKETRDFYGIVQEE